MAARVLGRLDAQSSVTVLIDALDDSNAQVRIEAATALGYLNAHAARERLELAITQDADRRVKDSARHALSLIR